MRRLPGALDDHKITLAPAILKGLGGDDPEQALNRLLLLQRQFEQDPEIVAAFATIGFGASGDTVLERLDDYARRQFVDARTVRRWSDAGIRKLARLITGAAPWIDPQIEMRLRQQPQPGHPYLTAQITVGAPLHVAMHEPTFSVDGQPQELEWREVGLRGRHHLRQSLAVPLPCEPGIDLALRLAWRGDLAASYRLDSQLPSGLRLRAWVLLREFRVVVNRQSSIMIERQ